MKHGRGGSSSRQERGVALAKSKAKAFRHIAGDTYLVPSPGSERPGYVVDVAAGKCTCPDYEERGVPCKHLWARPVLPARAGDAGRDAPS